jgi:hypothetical protein
MTNLKSSKTRCSCACHHHSRREFIRLGLGSLALLTARYSFAQSAATQPSTPTVKYYGPFRELPVGATQPAGWIQKWLQRQAQGLSGHPENMAYPYDTCMLAGAIPDPAVKQPADWWRYEQSGYYFDATARLNLLLADPAVKQRHQAALDYILQHSTDLGYGASQTGWPNAVIGRGLLADYSATGNPAIASLVHQYVATHAGTRDRDGVNAEEAFYLYGLTGDPRLLAYAQRVYDGYTGPASFCSVDKITGPLPLKSHGVTAAELLKILPLTYLYTGNPQALDLTKRAYAKVVADSLMPDGGIVSSESLGLTAFNSLHETCDITDWSWSLGYALLATGDARWADLIERATFNALPGAVSKDFKQLQYFSSANQILANNTACPRIALTRMSYRAAHETPCCAGNVNRAMPNYVARQWLRTDDGITAALYGPSVLNTTLNGRPLAITEETDYPFRETISFKVKTAQPATFALGLRIPAWCAAASVSVNGAPANLACQPGTFASLKRQFHDGDTVVLRLPMTVQLADWFNGSAVSIQRGPLTYSLQIGEKRVESTTDTDAIKRILKGNNIAGFPALEFYPVGEWRYGLDAATKTAPEKFTVLESPMPENPFLADTVPVRIQVPLRHLPQWQASWQPVLDPPPANLKLSPQNPPTLPSVSEIQPSGDPQIMTFVPYGSTHLRLTTLPVINSAQSAPTSV